MDWGEGKEDQWSWVRGDFHVVLTGKPLCARFGAMALTGRIGWYYVARQWGKLRPRRIKVFERHGDGRAVCTVRA